MPSDVIMLSASELSEFTPSFVAQLCQLLCNRILYSICKKLHPNSKIAIDVLRFLSRLRNFFRNAGLIHHHGQGTRIGFSVTCISTIVHTWDITNGSEVSILRDDTVNELCNSNPFLLYSFLDKLLTETAECLVPQDIQGWKDYRYINVSVLELRQLIKSLKGVIQVTSTNQISLDVVLGTTFIKVSRPGPIDIRDEHPHIRSRC